MRALRPTARAGFTLLELLVVCALLGTVLGAIVMTLRSTQGSYERGLSRAEVDAQAQRLLERIKAEVRSADRSSVALAPGAPFAASSLDYARAGGWQGGALVVETPRRLRMALAPGELDNGLDDNGNGLVDEQRVELLLDPVGNPLQAIGWGSWLRETAAGELDNGLDDDGNGVVDEPGLWFAYEPATGSLRIQVTLERALPGGRRLTSTKRATLQLRND